MSYNKKSHILGRSKHACTAFAGFLFLGTTHAQELIIEESEPVTVYGYRLPEDPEKIGNSVTILDGEELSDQGTRQLDQALKFVPGIISDTSSGQRGTLSSVFMRGNQSKYTGFIVDGFRMDVGASTFNTGNFIGTGGLGGVSQIEVLKGPQGVFFGASAMAGVVGISNAKGEGPLSGQASVEYGSFDTITSKVELQGSENDFSYSLSLGHETTSNDLPNNSFESKSYTLRLDYDITDRLSIGMTSRGALTDAENPNFADPAYTLSANVDFDYNLTTVFAELEANDVWISKLAFGRYDQDYISEPLSSSASRTDSQKYAGYWDNAFKWNELNTTSAGLSYEYSKYLNSSLSAARQQVGFYVNHLIDLTDEWNLSGGLRYTHYFDDEDNGFNGGVMTWRVASSYHIEETDSIFRASAGTGFQLPTFYEIYNITPNNDLDPAETLGWDLGFEQRFHEGQFSLGATYFHTNTENGIEYLGFTTGAIYGNSNGTSRNYGLEFFAEGSFLNDKLTASLSYTWLIEQALQDPQFLPANSSSLRLNYAATESFNAGLTITYLGDRALYGEELDAYALVNLYADYQLSDHVKLHARVDNLFNQEYFYGISPAFGGGENIRPGRGSGVFGGVTVEW